MTTLHNRLGYKELPSVEDIMKNKGCYVWHPKGAYVHVNAWKVNQYVLTLVVDLWNISYDVNAKASESFTRDYVTYLNGLKGQKGVPKTFTYGSGKTYNSIQVMKDDAEEWMIKLWSLCSDPKNLIHIPII